MSQGNNRSELSEDDMQHYAGRWVASLGNKVIGQGGTPNQALQAAKSSRFKETPDVTYVPTPKPFVIPPLIKDVRRILPQDLICYLVGGAIRDSLLGRQVNDLDFIVPKNAIMVARQVADGLGGAFYPLDSNRDIGRVILERPDCPRILLDFSVFQGQNLESDLSSRDFTINAMAVNIEQPEHLLDPLGGQRDLQEKQLRACSSKSFQEDAVRIVRAVRFAAAFDLHILPETRELMRSAIPQISGISAERLRDELFRILEDRQSPKAIRALDILGVTPHILPELSQLKGLAQSAPHVSDVWSHTIDVVKKLELILNVLTPNFNTEAMNNPYIYLVVTRLRDYREKIISHLNTQLVIDRSLKPLLFLAALYHDIGKAETQTVDDNGRIRYIKHDQIGAIIAAKRGQFLHLSNAEVTRLKTIVRHHLRPLFLAQTGLPITRKAVYRYYRDCGIAGIDICLLSLADILATYGETINYESWDNHLSVVSDLIAAWWENFNEKISPPTLVNGRDLLCQFNLEPGPIIGRILEAIREAQAAGQVTSRLEALKLAEEILDFDKGV